MSKVPAHYELIPEIIKLRAAISPETKLIINGDIKDRAHALKLHAQHPEVDGFMIGRGVFTNPYCFTNHTPTREELMELLKLHLNLYEEHKNRALRSVATNGECLSLYKEHKNRALRSVATNGELLASAAHNDGPARSGDERPYSYVPSYESLKHFFKIYINNFPGAKELRSQLMETHSLTEAHQILHNL